MTIKKVRWGNKCFKTIFVYDWRRTVLYVLLALFLLISTLGTKYSFCISGSRQASKVLNSFLIIPCLLFLIIYSGGILDIPDYTVYDRIYNYSSNGIWTKDIGFGAFVFALRKIGLSAYQCRLMYAVIGITVLMLSVRKFLDRKGQYLFLILYFIYPFFLDVIQVRNFLAMVFMTLAMSFLADNTKKSTFLFWVFMLVSASLQKTLLFYIPFILFYKADKRKAIKGVLIVAVILSVIIGLNKNFVSNLANYFLLNFSDKLSGSATFFTVNTRNGWLYMWAISLLNIAILYYIKKKSSNQLSSGNIKIVEIVFWINIYSLIALPLYVMDTNFFRIYRDLQPLNLIAWITFFRAASLKNIKINKRSMILLIITILLTILFSVYVTMIIENLLQYFIQGFNNNWIVGGI